MAFAIVLVLLIVAAVVFHVVNPWWFTPLASNWGMMDDTLNITLIITGVLFVVINLFIAYAVVRFRYREGHRAAYEPDNRKLEHWLTGLTTIGIIAMLAPGLVVYADFVRPPKNATVLEVVAQQWQWSFRLPGQDGKLGLSGPQFTSPDNPFGINPADPHGKDDVLIAGNEIHLPLNKPVKLVMRSRDVLHDFYVPQIRAKMDIVPGMITSFWFTPTRIGRFEILCAELCGVGHFNMRGHVVVEDDTSYRNWLAVQPTLSFHAPAAASGEGDLVRQGKQLAQDNGCVACHSVDGSKSVGPTWKGLFGKQETLADGKTLKVDDAYLRDSIRLPTAQLVKGYPPVMPPNSLNDQQVAALVAYIKSEAP